MSNIEKETPPVVYTVEVPGCVDLRFRGNLLVVSTDADENDMVVYKVAIKSGAEMYVVARYHPESCEKMVKICRNTQEIFDFLGYSDEAKILYHAACLDYYMYLGDLDDEMKEKRRGKINE